ncbi:MAG: Uma2 family endonuclease [Spirochaetaceae bacterium]|jgi:Uma2 family endonuclease|nr:Uma2 family endonuclease [Spirochaetaceae bacterium]
MPLLKEQEYYTYADYLSWDGEERYEIIDGEASMMAPPSRLHQEISRELMGSFWEFLKGKPCKVYAAPFAVRLNPLPDKRDDTVVEPDLAVVCDPAKLDDYGCNGAPDLIVEILSPSNTRYDRIVKFQKYREAGVREYWILDPVEKSLMVNVLKNNEYVASAYEETAVVPVTVLPGLEIDLKTVFVENEGAG